MSQALRLADFQSFQCQSAGRCCRNSWAIRVEPSARPDILASTAAGEVRRNGYQPLVVLADDSVAAGRVESGACVFLTAEELCGLHAELGGGRKPLACQTFPYAITATPEGYYTSLSFACPTVVAGIPGDLEANRRELTDLLLERGSAGGDLPHRVEVVRGRYVSWSGYRQLEGALLGGFSSRDPVGSLLSCAVGVVGALLETSPEADPIWPDLSAVVREEPFEESMLAMFCASVIALWERPDAPRERQEFSQGVLAGLPLYSQRHDLSLPPFSLEEPATQKQVEIYERYFQNTIFGKSLLSGPIVGRLLMLAAGFALVAFYARAFAEAAGETEPGLAAIARAFELVEADLITHTHSADGLFLAFESTLCQAYGLVTE